ncbi:uncharacterized protein LOC133794511 [Humulus lupulus]|uniref:uncharacterized protein LOC133794511 n=1 Tax=Humulus lupulus TaxID=3486 RepID=UPI002B411292|nr:uncharacterized protein LOC133794511 [Humulus lupulus]
MEGDENDHTPFWLQSSDSRRQRGLSRSTSSSSLLFNCGAFLIVLIVTALAFIFFIIPSILSFTSQIFKPQSVKKSWDALNLILVLFAIICGFLSRNSGENSSSNEDRAVSNSSSSREIQKSNPSTPHRWYQYLDQTESYNNGITRLRSSSSYPDLRQESSWVTRDERWQFYDDSHISNYRPFGSDGLHQRRRPLQESEKEEKDQNLETTNIYVDTFQVRTEEKSHTPEARPQPYSPLSPPPPPFPPPPPPSQPAAPVVKRKAKRSYQAIRQKDETERSNFSEVKNVDSQPPPPPLRPPPPPPPLPPPPTEYQESEPKSGKSEKKINTSTKDFLISLRRKKKKQRQKSVEDLDSYIFSIDHPYSLPSSYPSPSPPPPPPPPPPSVFYNLFSSKKGKARKAYSKSPPPPPPPPPPVTSSTLRVSKNEALSKPIPVTHKPPLSATASNFDIGLRDSATTGSESPPISTLIPPPPPPPPPFKIQDWKFVRRGDFVRIKSSGSSRSVSPDLADSEDSSSEGMSPCAVAEGGQLPASSMFCPSPDVDTKADNFIARFRAGLILEKENSFRQRDRAKSRFGPESGSGQKF